MIRLFYGEALLIVMKGPSSIRVNSHYFGQKWIKVAEEVGIEEWRIPTLIQMVDGDTDHLIAINMDGYGLARSALYVVESKNSGTVQEYYLNSFADKSILDMQIFGEDASKYTIILSYTEGKNDYFWCCQVPREISFYKNGDIKIRRVLPRA